MRTNLLLLAVTPALLGTQLAFASEAGHHRQIFHAFTLEADYGTNEKDPVKSWDLDGWVGSDYHKLWLKSEGEVVGNVTEQAEFWAMYSRNISTFWDIQAGLRHDTKPVSTSYLVMGVSGLAPYFFETEAHLFMSDEGDVSVRLRQENEFLITQRLILEPYLEGNLYAQDVSEQEMFSGLSDAEIGVQTRYEVTRKFAPYVDLRYERKLGETSVNAQKHGKDKESFIISTGIRLMF